MDAMNDKEIIKEARRRWETCEERDKDLNRSWLSAVKFANGNSENNWQWDSNVRKVRGESRPCITVNKVKVHNRQIINDGRQNRPRVVIKPADDLAAKRTAEMINGRLRFIERNSTADTAYDIAAEFAIEGGFGYWYLTTDYLDNESNNQEIFIKSEKNPLNCYLGSCEEFDGSDAKYGFRWIDVDKDDFKEQWPNAKPINQDWSGETIQDKDKIRVRDYYKKTVKKDTLYFLPDGTSKRQSDIDDPELLAQIKANPDIKSRKIDGEIKVTCYKIAGNEILEVTDWPGSYIPIIRVIGDEKVVGDEVIRTGNTHAMMDSQRMYNYELSSEIEFKALQGKTPWLVALEAIPPELIGYWQNANTDSLPYLPWVHKDSDGDPLPRPERQQPPMFSQAYIEGMSIASADMQAVTGQFDAQLGQNVNQQSGRALNAIQNRGAVLTFHFEDNKIRALKYSAMQIIELMQKLYDVSRPLSILEEDGKESTAIIDPTQNVAYVKHVDPQTGKETEIFNLAIGKYSVDIQVGASYGTRRQEAFTALTDIATRNPDFMQKAGDIYFEVADFPMADKIASRYERALPPELQDQKEGEQALIPPEVQQKLQAADNMIKTLNDTIEKMSDKLDSHEIEMAKVEIMRYEAETERMKSLMMSKTNQLQAENENIKNEIDDILKTEFNNEQEPPQNPTM